MGVFSKHGIASCPTRYHNTITDGQTVDCACNLHVICSNISISRWQTVDLWKAPYLFPFRLMWFNVE
jgi:hypothetical protein